MSVRRGPAIWRSCGVDDAQDIDSVIRFGEPVEHGVWEPSERCSSDGLVAGDHWSAARERLQAGEQPIKLLSELLVEP